MVIAIRKDNMPEIAVPTALSIASALEPHIDEERVRNLFQTTKEIVFLLSLRPCLRHRGQILQAHSRISHADPKALIFEVTVSGALPEHDVRERNPANVLNQAFYWSLFRVAHGCGTRTDMDHLVELMLRKIREGEGTQDGVANIFANEYALACPIFGLTEAPPPSPTSCERCCTWYLNAAGAKECEAYDARWGVDFPQALALVEESYYTHGRVCESLLPRLRTLFVATPRWKTDPRAAEGEFQVFLDGALRLAREEEEDS